MKRLLWLTILLTGCNTYQKQLNTFHIFAYNNPDKVAELCAKEYPCVGGETRSDTVIHVDTVAGQSKHDTTIVNGVRTVTVTIPKYITRLVTIHDTTKVIDNAKQAYTEAQLRDTHDALITLQAKLSDTQSTSEKWRKWCLILGGVIGLGALGAVLKFLGKI